MDTPEHHKTILTLDLEIITIAETLTTNLAEPGAIQLILFKDGTTVMCPQVMETSAGMDFRRTIEDPSMSQNQEKFARNGHRNHHNNIAELLKITRTLDSEITITAGTLTTNLVEPGVTRPTLVQGGSTVMSRGAAGMAYRRLIEEKFSKRSLEWLVRNGRHRAHKDTPEHHKTILTLDSEIITIAETPTTSPVELGAIQLILFRDGTTVTSLPALETNFGMVSRRTIEDLSM